MPSLAVLALLTAPAAAYAAGAMVLDGGCPLGFLMGCGG